MAATRLARGLLLALAAVACGVRAAPAVAPGAPSNVEIVARDPDGFADAGERRDRRRTVDALSRWLGTEAAGLVPPNDRLVVTITGLARAGIDLPSTRRPDNDIRIVRDLDPTEIDLDFQLADANGAVLKEGRRRLRDLGMSGDLRASRDDTLGREKALLRRWLAQEFGPRRPER